jgi:hypothetical protein
LKKRKFDLEAVTVDFTDFHQFSSCNPSLKISRLDLEMEVFSKQSEIWIIYENNPSKAFIFVDRDNGFDVAGTGGGTDFYQPA